MQDLRFAVSEVLLWDSSLARRSRDGGERETLEGLGSHSWRVGKRSSEGCGSVRDSCWGFRLLSVNCVGDFGERPECAQRVGVLVVFGVGFRRLYTFS